MLGKSTTVPVPFCQRQRQDAFYCPSGYKSEYTLFHTTRVIKYVFLDGSQNIVPSSPSSPSFEPQVGYLETSKGYYYPLVIPDPSLASSYWAPDLERLPIFVTLSKGQQKASQSAWRRPLFSRDRLPVFRQLCGEAAPVPSAASQRKVAFPKAAKEKLEKPQDAEMLGENGEGAVEEKDQDMPKMTSRERGAKP